MAIEIRTPDTDDVVPMFNADGRAFGFAYTPEVIEERMAVIDLSRYRIAVEHGAVVGVIGSFSFDVTLPGGTTVPMGAVTWVGVAATHRRQGLLRRMMDVIHDDIDGRGEPVAMLFASEGGIYERFGYGAGTHSWRTAIERSEATLRPELAVSPGSVRYVEGDAAAGHVAALWERYRRTRPGETSRSGVWQRSLFEQRQKPQGSSTPALYLAHDNGYAIYRIDPEFGHGRPAHRLDIVELVALTDEARLALWHTLLGVDLVGTITSRQIPLDDPLPYLLTNPRVVRTTGLDDGVWVHVRKVATCFAARTYRTTDRLVVEVDGERFAIDGAPEGASVQRVRTRPDLVATADGIGALLLGGVSPTRLACGRRLTARNDDALRRAELFFPSSVAPMSQTSY